MTLSSRTCCGISSDKIQTPHRFPVRGFFYVDNEMKILILCYMVKYYTSDIDKTFFALSDPIRRNVLMRLRNERDVSISDLAKPLYLKLPSLMKHLNVLQNAGLIRRNKIGRVVAINIETKPMKEAIDWLAKYESMWTCSLDSLTNLVENDANNGK